MEAPSLPTETSLPDPQGTVLLWLARASIEEELGGPHVVPPREPWLAPTTATFVTLTRNDELRGCVGSIEPRRPLGQDVIHSARAAAFRDLRFEPVTEQELPEIRIEVAALSPLVPLPVEDETEARSALVPGRDGVALSFGRVSSVFIPKVWEHLRDAGDLLEKLKQKAGLPAGFWSPEIRLHTFTARSYREP